MRLLAYTLTYTQQAVVDSGGSTEADASSTDNTTDIAATSTEAPADTSDGVLEVS
jgi:hypothetical protein